MSMTMAERSGTRQVARWGRMALMILTASTLAACGTMVPRTSTGPAPTQGLPTDTVQHRIALLVPQTGQDASVGQSIANATAMALADSRTDRIRITTYDTAGGAAAAAQRAIADGNKLILGPLLADDVRAVQPIARAANVPLLSYSNDSSVAGNGTYLLGFEPGQSIDRVIAHARAQGMTRFGALVPRSTYGERAQVAMRAAVTQARGTLVASQSYDRSAAGLSGAARQLARAGGMDAILIADAGGTAIRAVPLLRQNGLPRARILGTELWNNETTLSANAGMQGAWFASVSDTLFAQMASRYRERYGRAPFRIASLGYDSVLLTVRMSRDWRPGTAFPQNRLLASDGFGGIDGIFRFDNRGIAQRALEVSEVRSGGYTVVSPAPTQW